MSTKVTGKMGKSATIVAPKPSPSKDGANSKMHRRSRSGCYTCRLRRKKCDEGKDQCKACRHLHLTCEYKRPQWWSNNDLRAKKKEHIKTIIKRTKTTEKCTQQLTPMGGDTPPGLSYSLPTSATYSVTPDTRAPSVEDQCSPQYDFNHPPEIYDIHAPHQMFSPPYSADPYHQHFAPIPYEVETTTESQMYVNDVPTRKDSSTSSYSTWHRPHQDVPPYPDNDWIHDGLFENTDVFATADQIPDYDFYSHQSPIASHSLNIEVDDCDKPLLSHFFEHILGLLYPIMEINRPGFARSEMILPELASNPCFLKCCLSIAAEHLTSLGGFKSQEAIDELSRIRYATVQALFEEGQKESLGQVLDYRQHQSQLLDATLAMIIHKSVVGLPDEVVPDVPWHGHFKAIQELVPRLHLDQAPDHIDGQEPQTPVSMTQTTWIDILGATMVARNPIFAASYRQRFETLSNSGLRDMMGCDDKVMYLISEIACLDNIKQQGEMDEYTICDMIGLLGRYLDSTNPPVPVEIRSPVVPSGAIDAIQLSENVTALFRVAARIYLVGLVPDHTDTSASVANLVDQFADILDTFPVGPHGFDRSIVWPLLIGGSVCKPDSRLRHAINERIPYLGEQGMFGSFGRMVQVLQEVWRQSDEANSGSGGGKRNVRWRDVMQQHEGWQDFLLI